MADTRTFLRDNFSVYFRTILFIVGPIALLTCTLEMFYKSNLLKPGENFPDRSRFGSYVALSYIFEQIRWAVNGFVTIIVASHFIKVYREKGEGKFDVNDVGRSVLRDIFGSLLAFIVLFAGVVIIAVVLGYFMYGMAEVSMGTFIIVSVVGVVGYFLLRYPMWYYIFSVFFARTSQPKTLNVFPAMSLSGRVLSGSWWNTWVIFFCMWLILWLIGYMITLPAMLAGGILQLLPVQFSEDAPDFKLIQTILLSIGEFGKTIINSVFCISVALHFYSLKEKADGEGTKALVESIGAKNEDDGIELTY